LGSTTLFRGSEAFLYSFQSSTSHSGSVGYIRTMNIRMATEVDFDEVLRLTNAAFDVERFFKDEDRLSASTLRSYFNKGNFLVLEEDDKIYGSVYVELRGDRAYLGLLSVDPTQQRRGLGRRLTAAAEEFAREMGARFMDITVVNLRTELPPIYEKLGYWTTGTAPFPADQMPVTQPCHFICMTKELGHREP
jgi:predicted N-acetyltransferase YhbS